MRVHLFVCLLLSRIASKGGLKHTQQVCVGSDCMDPFANGSHPFCSPRYPGGSPDPPETVFKGVRGGRELKTQLLCLQYSAYENHWMPPFGLVAFHLRVWTCIKWKIGGSECT